MFKSLFQRVFSEPNPTSSQIKTLGELSDSEKNEYYSIWSNKQLLSVDELVFLYHEIVIPKKINGEINNTIFELLKSHNDFNEIVQFRNIILNQIEAGFFELSNKSYLLSEVNKNIQKQNKAEEKNQKFDNPLTSYSPEWLNKEDIIDKKDIAKYFQTRGWVLPKILRPNQFIVTKINTGKPLEQSERTSLIGVVGALSLNILKKIDRSKICYEKPDADRVYDLVKKYLLAENSFNNKEISTYIGMTEIQSVEYIKEGMDFVVKECGISDLNKLKLHL